MSRPQRNERTGTSSKGRPKRRAATNYLYKYQLAGDPNRIEENALKKALQESLEEQQESKPTVVTPPVSNRKNLNSTSKNKGSICKTRIVINSSTNSSDVSKGSNSSSSATNSSYTSRDLSIDNGSAVAKRLRSNATLLSSSSPQRKRVKLATNGLCNSHGSERCDNSDTCVLTGSPVPSFNGAIQRTYSRSQDSRDPKNSPRSSTPIAATRKQFANDNKSGSKELSVSTSTQTSNTKPEVILTRNMTTNDRSKVSEDTPTNSRNQRDANGNIKSDVRPANEQSQPVQNEYIKLKRESKNYAYAKMTALKVNTGKYYLSSFRPTPSNPRKPSQNGAPNGILNNNNTNKFPGKTSPYGYNKLNTSQPGLAFVDGDQISGNRNKSRSPNDAPRSSRQPDNRMCSNKASPKSLQGLQSGSRLGTPKSNSDSVPQGLKSSPSFNQTIELSRNQNQANVNVTKKRIAQGSWSLLGLPEEKILYIREDESPRRLICYPAIKHVEGDVIQVRDSVLLRSGAKQTDLPYIAKVCAFWEDAETGGVMMSLFWYYRPEHTEDGRKPHHLPDEIFASRHRDADSVECIEDKCYVLTFNEYCRYRKRCKMEQVNTTWSLTDVTIPVSNESYPRRNRIPDSSVNPELVFCCRQIYDSRSKRLLKNPLINPKYGNI